MMRFVCIWAGTTAGSAMSSSCHGRARTMSQMASTHQRVMGSSTVSRKFSFLVRSITRGCTTPSVTTSRGSSRTISATGRKRRRRRRRGKFTRAHTPAHTPACGPGILEARRAGGGRSLCTNRHTSRLARWIARGSMPQSSTTDSARAAPRRYQTVLTPLPANDNTAARQ